MSWTKLGVLLTAPPPLPWAASHAALPVIDPLDDGRVRIYFSTRDEANRSRIASVDVDLSSRAEVHYRPDPVLDLGSLGAFDDSGVTTACLVRTEDRRYLYYSGWTTGVTVPFYFYIGCAVSDDEGRTWSRISPAPLLDRDSVDPFLTASPTVLIENGTWRMWYVSGTGWSVQNGRPQHRYHLKYAESTDGTNWQRTGRVCIDFRDESEYSIARPSVIKDGDRYRMWFCARGTSYRIFYAESLDGFTWERHDEPAIEASTGGWDAEMQAYPLVFDHAARRHMLYNGNGYGATGIGHALLDEAP